jgi:hypothetical protein
MGKIVSGADITLQQTVHWLALCISSVILDYLNLVFCQLKGKEL